MKTLFTLVTLVLSSLALSDTGYAGCTPSRTMQTIEDTWCNGPNLTIRKSERNTITFPPSKPIPLTQQATVVSGEPIFMRAIPSSTRRFQTQSVSAMNGEDVGVKPFRTERYGLLMAARMMARLEFMQ